MNATPQCVLGIDLGTSSLKCLILEQNGDVRASATESYPTSTPRSGWAEQDPADWYDALKRALLTLTEKDRTGVVGLRGIGICSAAHIPVLLDEQNRVIRPAIIWSDQRSGDEVDHLNRERHELLRKATLNEAGCTWTLPQLRWLRRHEPEHLARAKTLLSSKDYLIFRMCGRFVMDTGSAAATLMLDAQKKTWCPEIVTLSGLPLSAMPPVHSSFDTVGTVTDSAATDLGLPTGIPIFAGGLDSAAELLGCGILEKTDGGMIRVGSSGGVMIIDRRPTFSGGVITYPYLTEGRYLKQAGTNSCATSLQWIRNSLAVLGDDVKNRISYPFIDKLVAATLPGSEGLVFHPYLQGERAPYWNPNLRASFTGLESTHGWQHFLRATMEGVAFSLRDCLAMFARDGLRLDRAVMAGGITKSTVWSQIIADVLGIELYTTRHGDSAFGAALMAAVGGRFFPNMRDAVATCVKSDRTIVPSPDNAQIYAKIFRNYAETAKFFNSRIDI